MSTNQSVRLFQYTGTEADGLLVAGMWARMKDLGDLDRIFGKDIPLPDLFLTLSQAEFVYAVSDDCIVAAWWFTPMMESRTMAMWRDPERVTKFVLWASTKKVLDAQFTRTEAVLMVTKQPDLLALFEKIGYNLVAQIPGMFPGGETGHLGILTRDAWDRVRRKRRQAQLTFAEWTGDERWLS